MKWENTTNEKVLEQARTEIRKSWRRTCADHADHPRAAELFDSDKLPAFHDPFAGGGALPLEAQRLGLEAHASDLNPVAVLINKAMIEIPPKFAGQAPVNPEARRKYLGARASRPHKAWHSRGYLPHLDQPGTIQSLTFRLFDSVPIGTIEVWKSELALTGDEEADDPRYADLRKRIEHYADQGHGVCWLRDERIAGQVEKALFHFDGTRYRLLAWVVMPNHVHALIETLPGFPLADIIHSWKSYTAKQANKTLERAGTFWMPDYFDRYIRDEQHLVAVTNYIEQNPVKAGLVQAAGDWQWSSAAVKTAGETPALPGFWKGAQGLAEDVRYYGQWMRDEAERRIGHLYPQVEITEEMVRERPDLERYKGRKLTVIAWLWARTVKSPNPAFADVEVPLASTFMLSKKKGKEAYVEPVIEGRGYRFVVKVGTPEDTEAAKAGTKLARGANFRCVMSGAIINDPYIKAESMAGRMGARLMAIVAEGDRGRVYMASMPEHEEIVSPAEPMWKPDQPMNRDTRDLVSGRGYGFFTWADLFTPRQLVALTTLSDLVTEAIKRVERDILGTRASGPLAGGTPAPPSDDIPLRDGGTGATAYAEAVGIFLALAVSKETVFLVTQSRWRTNEGKSAPAFGRQAIPMVWDYADVNPFAGAGGDFFGVIKGLKNTLLNLPPPVAGHSAQADAANQETSHDKLVSTDPPYYDNIGYADLSDFFYVWLRHSLKPIFPNLFATMAVPKAEELVATLYRHGSRDAAETFFLDGMCKAMHCLAEQTHPAFPTTIYYAFKQSETKGDTGTASTGWETFLDAVIRAGFGISGTWPMRTENATRLVGMATNALASSIVLVCRQRPASAPMATRREFVAALRAELPTALAHLQSGNIAPVDLAQAAIGPGMAVFTRYAKVLDAEGNPVSVREALALINQMLDEVLAEQEGDFDPDSRWALAWFEQQGFDEGEYGVAETLSKAKNTSIAGIVEGGILASSAGKVRLLRPDELADDWDPTTDDRLTVWEAVHHLIRALETGGEKGAAQVVSRLGTSADIARELAYRLYTICERKRRAAEALSYNSLVQSWPEIADLARQEVPDEQGELFDDGATGGAR